MNGARTEISGAPGDGELGPEVVRVLVADDEPGIRTGVERALGGRRLRLPEAAGREVYLDVTAVDSGEAALAAVAMAPPDLLLLDQKLPGLSGQDVLARLTREAPQVLTVMITAYASIEAAVAATRRGAYDFLAKPFSPEELRTAVAKAARHALLQRQAHRHAQEKQRLRFEFVSVLAHELKAPLAAVEGYLLDMQAGVLGPRLDPYQPSLGRCVERLRGLRRLVVDLLDLTRLESGERRREVAPVDLAALALDVLETLRPLAETRRLTLVPPSAGPVWLMGDRLELELLVTNLVDNAIKYNHDGGQVEVTVERREDRVTLEVRDTGVGVPQDELPRLFQEFVRVRADPSRHIPGSGLGLATVRKVARLHGGDATLSSRPGAGTTAVVWLAACAPPPPAPAPASPR